MVHMCAVVKDPNGTGIPGAVAGRWAWAGGAAKVPATDRRRGWLAHPAEEAR
jgi:hypothetical protein